MQSVMPDDPTAAWRSCTFRITWPEDTEPDWSVDLLLAHQFISPVLAGQGNDIYRWRFHRRANRDAAGHQFSFIFYTGSTRARAIIDQIQTNPLRSQLLDSDVIEAARCDSPTDTSRSGIRDTSDPNWTETMQKNWPSYIMGVSTLWLGLIDDAVQQVNINTPRTNALLRVYRMANDKITETWQQEGQHAFLHHLTAIFGYEELLIRY
jgi:hypothetical protein